MTKPGGVAVILCLGLSDIAMARGGGGAGGGGESAGCIRGSAKDISDQYVRPPHSTDVAVTFFDLRVCSLRPFEPAVPTPFSVTTEL
jgi:hypothetical protein